MLIWWIPKENNGVSHNKIQQNKWNKIHAITYSNDLS